MSLVSFALRIATARVLRNATYAGPRVYDSMISPADLLHKEADAFIVVAVDSAERIPEGRDLLGAACSLELTLDAAVASRVTVKTKDGEEDEQEFVSIPHTDGGMEVTLDLMMRQTMRALLTSTSPWAVLWRTLVTKISKVQIDRGASAEKGVRFAARQTVMTLDVIAEPSFGEPEGVWADLLALMRDDAEFADLADILELEIASPALDEWARGMADLGLNSPYSLGGGPLVDPPPQPISGITVRSDGPPMQIDEQTATDALGPAPSDDA